MSQERRKKQQEREAETAPNPWMRKIVIALAIVVVVAGIVLLFQRRQSSRLDAFAQCLGTKGAKMYGAYWCPHCQQEKAFFGASAGRLPYVECSPNGQNAPQASECQSLGIQSYPTWIINGKHIEEVMTLQQLADATGFKGPVTSASN